MKFAVICTVALLTLSLTACAKSTTTGGTETTAAPMAAATMAPAGGAMSKGGKSTTVTMNAQNASGETGTATLTAKGTKTQVAIALKGEEAGYSQPAHIHPGSCAKLNPIPKYPLSPVVGGKSTTVVPATLASLSTGHWAINVHESAKNLKKYVSCGDIK